MNTAYTDAARLLLQENAVLLSLPAICVQLRRVLDDPEHSRKDIAAVMRYDPALSARLLRIVNSPYYGLPNPVGTISQALGILGEQELENLVLVTSLMKLSRELDARFDITRFWKTSVYTAVLARKLCPPSLLAWREDSFVAGLLLNIGKLPLYCKEASLLAAVDQCMQTGDRDEIAAERELTGTDHAQVGAMLAESWHFPQGLRDLIREHHELLADDDRPEHCLLRLAGYFGDWHERHEGLQPGPSSRDLRNCPWSLGPLGLDAARFWELLQQSHAEYLEVHELFCGDTH